MEHEYTIGQLAKLAGITTKTLRVYENKGLITPKRNSENDYRIYGDEAVKTLEKIQLMKYLDFSLDRISEFLHLYENISRENMLLEQKRLLERKQSQLNTVIAHVDRAINECSNGQKDSDEFLKALGTIVKNQRADEVVGRLRMHSDEPRGWSRFIYDQTNFSDNMHILDAGAGYGNLWRYNMDRLCQNLDVTCLDFHNTHMDTFASYIEERKKTDETGSAKFSFSWGDMEEEIPKGKYDRIFLNHAAYYINDRPRLYQRFKDSLSKNGAFICTWGGLLFYTNINPILYEFLGDSKDLEEQFKAQVAHIDEWEQELREVFPHVSKRPYVIPLYFENAEALTDYIAQVCKPVREILEAKRQEFLAFIEKYRNSEGHFVFERDTYLYYCN